MPIKLFVLYLLIYLAINGSVIAQTPLCNKQARHPPMKTSLHQIGDKQILLLVGKIQVNSGEIVGPAIRKKSEYKEVWLCSSGGAVKGGLAIGKILNQQRATVKVPDHFLCASACTIAFMGGYARFIDPNAKFVTHASSSAGAFGMKFTDHGIEYSHFGFYECNKSWSKHFCDRLRSIFREHDLYNKIACAYPEDLSKVNTKCMFFDTNQSRYSNNIIIANSQLTQILGTDELLTKMAIEIKMRNSLKSELELLHYFQTMLLDGQVNYTKRESYRQIEKRMVPVNIYELHKTDIYYRSLKKDISSLRQVSGNLSQTFAMWQAMLTDSELSLKTQVGSFIRQNKINLGFAGKDAVKMYDAMRTCQIQSSCQLEPHTARSLGYHNMYEYE